MELSVGVWSTWKSHSTIPTNQRAFAKVSKNDS